MDRLLEDVEAAFRSGIAVKARLRPHPNEKTDKYDSWLNRSARLEASRGRSLVEDIAWADLIVGLESMAMVISLYSGKPVFSILPFDAKKPYYLPFPEILRIPRPAEAISRLRPAKGNP
jgi:hypothetical protein